MQSDVAPDASAKSKTNTNKSKSALGDSNVVKVADAKEWLAAKPFEKTPLQKSNSSESIQSLNSKLHGTVQARKQWLASAFTDRGSNKSDTVDVSDQWESLINDDGHVQGRHTTGEEESISSDATASTVTGRSSSEPATDPRLSPSFDCDDAPAHHEYTQEQERDFIHDNDETQDPRVEPSLDLSRLTTNHYSQARVCVILVQAVARRYLVRRQVVQETQAAIKIQSHVRRTQGEAMYELQLFAVVLLQSSFRGFKVRNQLERHFAILFIQSAARGWLVRKRSKQTYASVLVQSLARGWLVRDRLEQAFASVLVQSVARGWLVRKHAQDVSKDRAAIELQACWRRHQAQSMYELQQFAIVVLQSVTRGWSVRRRLERSMAASLLQSVIRGWRVRKRLEHDCMQDTEECAALRIQTLWRTYQARTLYELKVHAAIRLQSVLRVFLVQKRLEKTYAAGMIQSFVRGWLVRARLEQRFAAAYIQSVARGWLQRKDNDKNILVGHDCRDAAATLIQARWRQYVAQSMYEMQSIAIVVVQSVVRVFLVQKQLERMYAAALVQAVARGWLVRVHLEKTFAAAMLQAIVRGWLARIRVKHLHNQKALISETFNRQKTSIAVIQNHWRMCVARLRSEKQDTAAVVIQSVVRVFLVQKQLEKVYAAALLQSVTRGWLVRRQLELTFAAVLLQSMIRGWLVRVKNEKRGWDSSATLVQRQWRRFQAQSMFELKLFAIQFLQALIRGHQARATAKRRVLSCTSKPSFKASNDALGLEAITSLQALVRGGQARSKVRFYKECVLTASTSIPSMHLHHATTRSVFRQTFVSVLLLHSFARGMRSSNLTVTDDVFEIGEGIPTHIQAAQRGRALLLDHHRRLESASVLQAWAKRVMSRRAAARTTIQTRASLRVQAAWRRYLASKRRDSAATLIQARWRGSIEKEAYEFYKVMVKAATVVQVAWREFMLRRARVRRSLLALSPSRGHHYVRRQFLFNSSYSLVSVTPSSPSSVTVFTSSDYSVLHASNENSPPQVLSEARPVHASPQPRRKPARVTLDLSNPKSRLAPVLTWFGAPARPATTRSTDVAARAAITIQKTWRGHTHRQRYRQKRSATKLIQIAVAGFLLRRRRRQRCTIPRSLSQPTEESGKSHARRAPYRAKNEAFQRLSFLKSARAPVLTWF